MYLQHTLNSYLAIFVFYPYFKRISPLPKNLTLPIFGENWRYDLSLPDFSLENSFQSIYGKNHPKQVFLAKNTNISILAYARTFDSTNAGIAERKSISGKIVSRQFGIDRFGAFCNKSSMITESCVSFFYIYFHKIAANWNGSRE